MARLALVPTCLVAVAACGNSGSGSASATDGGGDASSSGASNGGASNGGASAGGVANGGASTGGVANGGASTGGASNTRDGGAGGPAASTGGADGASDAAAPSTDGGRVGTFCTSPVFVTSDPNGGYTDAGYYVHNNMWNSAAGLGPETLYACSYHSWYVVSNQTNDAGAVKTYPNVHIDYADVPISSFNTITSTFAETSPHVGIYNVAYDIWTNGVATSGSTEFMIWTENFNQVPAGSNVATMTSGGRTYDVWKTSSGHYIAFVPTVPFTSGTVDILDIFQWTTAQGWFPSNSTLGQIDFGVEIVDTAGGDATFHFTDFSIVTN